MNDLIDGLLKINIENKENEIYLNWEGDSRDIDPASFLDPYLAGITEQIKTLGKKLIVNFKDLNSMNSSTVLPILKFIKNLEKESIQTEIIFDEESSWQKASFIPLSAITKLYKFVKVIR